MMTDDEKRAPTPCDIFADIFLGRMGDAEARARVEANARENWPDAEWGPFDDPPVGTRVRLPSSLSHSSEGDAGTVVGLFRAGPETWPRPHDCPGCACERPRPHHAGWWAMQRDSGGLPVPVYPPSVTRA